MLSQCVSHACPVKWGLGDSPTSDWDQELSLLFYSTFDNNRANSVAQGDGNAVIQKAL